VDAGDRSLACAWALVDVLAAGGVEHACLSPGSRSTPLALALSRHPRIQLQVHLEERSSAFVALGIAKATMLPVIVACTSGTATAELFPAVVEAWQSRVPLILLTADRPPRLRGTGANQTIDQVELFGRYATYLEAPVPSSDADVEAWGGIAERVLDSMRTGTGPIHVNCPFDEPLVPNGAWEPPTPSKARDRGARTPARLTAEESDRLIEEVSGKRGVVVIGGWPGEIASVVRFWHEVMQWPVLAEPTSTARVAPYALSTGQALISSPWIEPHRPEVVLQLGATPTTRAMRSFLASAPRLVVADRFHLDPDPEHRAHLRLHVDPELEGAFSDRALVQRASNGSEFFTFASGEGSSPPDPERMWERRYAPAPGEWLPAWTEADVRARTALDAFFNGQDHPFEPRIARDVAAWLPDGGTLFVGNSTPVRDLDLAMAPRGRLRVLANRGASGIDGLVSTAIGIAIARRAPTVALIGDLSFVYDVGALMWNGPRGVDLALVVVNNGGGEVFSLLPGQLDLPEHRSLFVTPHGLDLGAICHAAGVGHTRVERAGDLSPALTRVAKERGIQVIEVVVDPELGRRRRDELRRAVAASLED
jgi:2-succinyl-5-enolpyruvyl-6-hydroxy-3-cyclohexene-1-carboxylate synthase